MHPKDKIFKEKDNFCFSACTLSSTSTDVPVVVVVLFFLSSGWWRLIRQDDDVGVIRLVTSRFCDEQKRISQHRRSDFPSHKAISSAHPAPHLLCPLLLQEDWSLSVCCLNRTGRQLQEKQEYLPVQTAAAPNCSGFGCRPPATVCVGNNQTSLFPHNTAAIQDATDKMTSPSSRSLSSDFLLSASSRCFSANRSLCSCRQIVEILSASSQGRVIQLFSTTKCDSDRFEERPLLKMAR